MIYGLINVIALSKRYCGVPIQGHLAYATTENFVGRILDGYSADISDICLMTESSALALCQVQNTLLKYNIGIYIYDAYRPLRTVKDFARWAASPVLNAYELTRKQIHYPNINKTDLAKFGYIADSVSRHNFGHVVDLMLIDINTHTHLDMGACFDYFDLLSHTTATEEEIGSAAYQNRLLLSNAMQQQGFMPYENEFWHFEYSIQDIHEPMDTPISSIKSNAL